MNNFDSNNLIGPDDFRLTAYALGELDGEDKQLVEAAIAADPKLRSVIDEIRGTATQLTAALDKEPLPVVPHSHVEKYQTVRPAKIFRFPYWAVGGLAAACFAVLIVFQQTEMHRSKSLAETYKAKTGESVSVALPSASQSLPASTGNLTVHFNGSSSQAAGAMTGGDTTGTTVADAEPAGETYVPLEKKDIEAKECVAAARNMVREQAIAQKERMERNGRAVAKSAPPSLGIAARAAAPAMQAPGGENQSAISASPKFNTEGYDRITDNAFMAASQNPLSTFSIDVDTASYANVRRFLNAGQLPPKDAVRIEELVNYFSYDYAAPAKDDTAPFAASMEVASAPWKPEHRLVRVGLRGKAINMENRAPANFVFLLDVSGSMNDASKLPLVQKSMRMLVDTLNPSDRIAIVVYAGSSGLALPSTPVSHRSEIISAIDELRAGGSTNGAMGIQLAYDIAKANFIEKGINRVILCTDGDFNVGVTNQGDLTRLIEEKAQSGVFLTALGFGMGNYKDTTLEKLADKGNGNYGYIDSFAEAKRMLVEQAGGTLVTIAKDVKVQVEFNPTLVQAYRLIGYENRMLKAEDFNNDKIDAGEIGAGHTVTALYEVVPAGVAFDAGSVDALKYSKTDSTAKVAATGSAEMLTLKIRYKQPDGQTSSKLEFPLVDQGRSFAQASDDFKFASSIAAFGMVLRDSAHKGIASFANAAAWAEQGIENDPNGYRREFLTLIQKAASLDRG